jgi:hypothetical protein
MLERRHDVQTIAAERAMIAVVQHNDIPVRTVRLRYARQTFNQSLRRLWFPVAAQFRPHHNALEARAANFSIK